MASKVVVITGANRGIGRSVVERLLAESPQYTVIMTARSPEEGTKAYREILRRGDYASRFQFHPLDIRSRPSIEAFRDHLSSTVRQIDILVNNAGVNAGLTAGHGWLNPLFNEGTARENVLTNFVATADVAQILLPLLKPRGHIVFVTSSRGQLREIPGAALRTRLASNSLTTAETQAIGQEFIQSARDNTFAQKGWPRDSYVVSKNLINAYIRAFNRDLRSAGSTIRVNALCPGWVQSDMGGSNATYSLAEGAETPLALIRYEGEQTGTFWQNSRVSNW